MNDEQTAVVYLQGLYTEASDSIESLQNELYSAYNLHNAEKAYRISIENELSQALDEIAILNDTIKTLQKTIDSLCNRLDESEEQSIQLFDSLYGKPPR